MSNNLSSIFTILCFLILTLFGTVTKCINKVFRLTYHDILNIMKLTSFMYKFCLIISALSMKV